MSGLILCDRRSDVPYRITDAEINVYSLEEIAYFLYNNAYFVDDSFFKSDLVDYVEKHLKLSRVAQKLRYAMANRAGFYELVMIIMSSTSQQNPKKGHRNAVASRLFTGYSHITLQTAPHASPHPQAESCTRRCRGRSAHTCCCPCQVPSCS